MALKNIMRVDNGNVVGADTEARNFINNNLIASVNGTDVEFKFIYDSTQDKFGYRDASGTFVPFESGGDFSQLIYENLAAANIKKGVTINVKDPDGNVLNSATGSYAVNTFTNLTEANVKQNVTVTIKDSNNTTLKTVTGTYYQPTASYDTLISALNWYPNGTTTRTYKTTKAYRWIVGAISPSVHSGNVGYGQISVNKGTRSKDIYGQITNDNYHSITNRLVTYSNVSSGSTITATPGTCDNCVILVIGIV